MGRDRFCCTCSLVLALVLVSLAFSAPAAGGQNAGDASAAPPLIAAHARLSGVSSTPPPVRAQGAAEEPIAYIGHGAFFDRYGRQLVPTAEFVASAQSWYRTRLLAGLNPDLQARFAAFERRLSDGLRLDGQAVFVVQQRALDWLVAHSPGTTAVGRMQAKLNALGYRLSWKLARRDDLNELRTLELFQLDPRVEARLTLPEFNPGGRSTKTATTNSGQAYINECQAAGVPIPPTINVMDPNGTAGWKSLGFIPPADQFINQNNGPRAAEVRVFKSAAGMCIALPRYNANQTLVTLDGVICLSQTTSKVCFWDNQMNGNTFTFAPGTQIPIGVPNLAINPAGRYQAGGAEIEFGAGGVCTDCHAGENPYIIHPDSNLGAVLMGDLGAAPLNLPTFGPNRYDPIVGASWPQNQLSHALNLVPNACKACHVQGDAGRFPHLSSALPGYCGTILAQAITNTMPQGNPGGLAGNPAIVAFQNWCNSAPNAGPANRGDPHLTTTNGIHYDFQPAGEFVSLRNSDTGFELQTRQTPVLTLWTPGPNAYTGLSNCVSLNTAAALRVGEHRISYQPASKEREEMQLRIDGKPLTLPSGGLNLGDGNWIATAAAGGGIDVRVNDGTRVIITPNYWNSEGYWYLNVEVLNTPAREGTMGTILGSDWLPLAPDGSSFGPPPTTLGARDVLLNKVFADAWRVTDPTSLFDYEAGTSTATFTERNWPPPSGKPCTAIPSNPWPGGEPRRPVAPMSPEQAQSLCRPIEEKEVFLDCVFDLTATGNAAMADDYLLTLQLRKTP